MQNTISTKYRPVVLILVRMEKHSNMEHTHRIGAHIRKWRNLKAVKQKDLAAALKISEAAMSNIENNITDITLGQLEDVSRALNLSLDQLFTDPQESIAPPAEYKSPLQKTSVVEEKELLYAVIRSLELKDQQLQTIMQNVLQAMTTLAVRW